VKVLARKPKLKVVKSSSGSDSSSDNNFSGVVISPTVAPPKEERERCIAMLRSGERCRRPARAGKFYCSVHAYKEKGAVDSTDFRHEFNQFKYGNVLDVISAYLGDLEEDERKFIMQVYGDASLDAEIALLRLVIRKLILQGTNQQQFQLLPRLVSSLADCFREALNMIEGNRLVVEFTSRVGEEYWRELFKGFKRLVEETLYPQLCSDCQHKIDTFVKAGTEGEIVLDVAPSRDVPMIPQDDLPDE